MERISFITALDIFTDPENLVFVIGIYLEVKGVLSVNICHKDGSILVNVDLETEDVEDGIKLVEEILNAVCTKIQTSLKDPGSIASQRLNPDGSGAKLSRCLNPDKIRAIIEQLRNTCRLAATTSTA